MNKLKLILITTFLLMLGSSAASLYVEGSTINFLFDTDDELVYIDAINNSLMKYNLTQEFIRFEVVNMPDWDYYGWYWMFTNRIIINAAYSYDLGFVIDHEIQHLLFFQLPVKQQLDFCDVAGFKYNTDCWEHYANMKNKFW